jgi:hypothetical protein
MTLPARIAMKSRGTVVGHAPGREVGKPDARHRAHSLLSEVNAMCRSARSSRNRSAIIRFDPGPKSFPPNSAQTADTHHY